MREVGGGMIHDVNTIRTMVLFAIIMRTRAWYTSIIYLRPRNLFRRYNT